MYAGTYLSPFHKYKLNISSLSYLYEYFLIFKTIFLVTSPTSRTLLVYAIKLILLAVYTIYKVINIS